MKVLVIVLVSLMACIHCTKHSDEPLTKKILRVAMVSDIKGFDPISASDEYSHIASAQIYEGLLDYEYLKRPYELRPLLAESLPRVSKDKLTYTFRLRKNVRFHEDAAFKGKPRYVKSSDVVYSFLRLADPHLKSPNWWVLEGKIQGLDDLRKRFELAQPPIHYQAYSVPGLKTPDDQTLIVTLTRPCRQFLYGLAMPATLIVAPEVVETYGVEFLNHPVGTGPFILREWKRGQKIVYDKNPHYWGDVFPTQAEPEDRNHGLLVDAEKTLPLVDQLVIWIYVETQPQWLNFLRGHLDVSGIPKEAFDHVIDEHGNLKKELQQKQIVLNRRQSADLVLFAFNMEDPVIGSNKYLRQAISAAINRTEKIQLFYNNRAIVAHGPIPPGLFGYDENLKDPFGYDVEHAKQLAKKALEKHTSQTKQMELPPVIQDITNGTYARQLAEAVTHDLEKVGLGSQTRVWTWPQFSERMAKRQIQIGAYAWNADYPDAENFLQLLYSKNVSPGPNHANFSNREYDRMYEKMRDLQDDSKRVQLISNMIRIIHEEVPWVFFNHRIGYTLHHSWVKNLKGHAFTRSLYKYINIDLKQQKEIVTLLR